MFDVVRRRVMMVLIVAVGPMGPARADESETAHTLRYRFTPGQVVHFRVSHTMTFSSRKGQFPETSTNRSDSWKHYRVLSVEDDGSAELEMVIDRVRMSARFNQDDPVTVDSNAPDECPTPYKGVLKTVGRPLARITISPRGELLAAEAVIPEELQERVSGGAADETADDPAKNPLILLPEQPVRVGDSWHDDIEVPVHVTRTLKQPVTLRRKYTLESVDGAIATIHLRTVILTPVRDPAMQVQLIQRTPEGRIEFDREKGNVVSRTLTVNGSVIGAMGPNSLVRAESEQVETQLTPAEAAAAVEP